QGEVDDDDEKTAQSAVQSTGGYRGDPRPEDAQPVGIAVQGASDPDRQVKEGGAGADAGTPPNAVRPYSVGCSSISNRNSPSAGERLDLRASRQAIQFRTHSVRPGFQVRPAELNKCCLAYNLHRL